MTVLRRLAIACGLTVFALPVLATTPMSKMMVHFNAQNNSGESGSGSLTAQGSKTLVTLNLAGAPKSAQPAHIHKGTCAHLDPAPQYPLGDVVNGTSTSTVPVSLAALMHSPHAINVHKSSGDLKTYVACADITPGPMMHM
ncbi:MAG TPA: hypothetical protein VKG44_06980 [Candidatus Baltobacteraceae bacterium]|nr:hypothetical protein [Candidatus Baltobacteraceae bacterium]